MGMIDSNVLLELFELQKQENAVNGFPLYSAKAIQQCIKIVKKAVNGDFTTIGGVSIPQKGESK